MNEKFGGSEEKGIRREEREDDYSEVNSGHESFSNYNNHFQLHFGTDPNH